MNYNFEIGFEWLADDLSRGPCSFAAINLCVNGVCATELEDRLAKTVRASMRVSAEALALWFAGNWWRLRWEPQRATLEWRMSHMIGAAGGGFVWPDMALIGDGEFVLIENRPTSFVQGAPIRYLTDLAQHIPVAEFERRVDDFVNAVIERLTAGGVSDSSLPGLWREVCDERANADLSAFRRLEAMLGFDPDTAPEELISDLQAQSRRTGPMAMEEIAAVGPSLVQAQLKDLFSEKTQSAASDARLPGWKALHTEVKKSHADLLPWQHAERAAKLSRATWGIASGPVSNKRLSDIFSVDVALLNDTNASAQPISAGFRRESEGAFKVAINKHRSSGRRFELARIAADNLYARADDFLLPCTMAKTARQKFQRAFAQELLCPYEELSGFLGSDTQNEDQIEDAANHFQVSPLLVRTTLVNRGDLDRDVLVSAS